MRKKTISGLIILAFAAMAANAGAIPIHNIGINIGLAMPGEQDINDFYGITLNDKVYAYNFGIDYNFAPIEYFSVGVGCNYLYKSFVLSVTSPIVFQDTTNDTAIEPFGQVRFYYPLTSQIDVFAGGGVGYAVLAGATYNSGLAGVTYDLNGSGITYRFGGGLTYTQGIFTTLLDVGYKIAKITPYTMTNGNASATVKNFDGTTDAAINFGGIYVNINASYSFGSHAEAKNDRDIKSEMDKQVNLLDSSTPAGTVSSSSSILETSAATTAVSTGAAESNLPAANTVPSQAETPAGVVVTDTAPEPTKEEIAVKTRDKGDKAQIAEDTGADNEGIIILLPGESEPSQMEKYVGNKSKQFKPEETTAENEEERGGTTFEYEPDSSGIVLLESESKGKVEKAGYVLVERGGFISNNFTEDGFIYSLDEHKELLSAPDFAYIKLTVGKGAPKGKEFTIYTDGEDVMDTAAGESMGKFINFVGVAKVVEPIEDNIYKVQIKKSYEPIFSNYKIKARSDMKKYSKDLNLKVRKKNLAVEAYIVKVKDNLEVMKGKDLVYIDAGVSKGLLPGEKMGIYRPTQNNDTGIQENYHKIGTLLIINSVQSSSVGFIIKSDDVIRVGDIVKTILK
jgi:hypothetical protein